MWCSVSWSSWATTVLSSTVNRLIGDPREISFDPNVCQSCFSITDQSSNLWGLFKWNLKFQTSPLYQPVTMISRRFFSKAKATSLPPRQSYNCGIDLFPGTMPPKGRLYSLSGPETKALKEYIQSSLWASVIRPSSPAGAGFFFAGKKDGALQPCISFWMVTECQRFHKTWFKKRLSSSQNLWGRWMENSI